MMNLRVRVKQKWFWLTLIPLVFLLIDQLVGLLTLLHSMTIGDVLYNSSTMELVMSAVGTVFAILALIGFPVDLTTEGYGDSAKALEYDAPAMNAAQEEKLETKLKNAKHKKE